MSVCNARQDGLVKLAVLLVAVAVLGIAITTWHLLITQPADDEGSIELSDLALDLGATHLNLDISARVRLSPTVEDGLDSGVPLTFLLDLKILQPRRFWLDKSVLSFQREYTLTYYDLTRHYRVSALKDDVSRNFRSMSSALAGLGEMVHMNIDLEAAQAARLQRDGLRASVVMQLSRSALPLPLQPIFRSSWTLVSREYQWSIT